MTDMPTAHRIATIIAICIVFAAIAFYVLSRSEGSMESAFFAEGNLVKDSPGLKSGVWYLAYEEPGFPGLAVPLSFDEATVCTSALKAVDCAGFLQGDRVQISGTRGEEAVRVKTLVFVNPAGRSIPVRLYFYDAGKEGKLCNAQELVAVERVLPYTPNPLAESIRLLLRGEISDEEKAVGVSSEYPLLGVRLESAAIENGVATLRFSDEQGKTNGGACRVNILRAQIESTAKQFPGVTEVRILPAELFQP